MANANPNDHWFARQSEWQVRESIHAKCKRGDGLRGLTSLRDERGAAATVFVLFLGSGVLIALFAMTADAGAVFRERRVTQAAADASSLAVASFCALGSPECASQSNLVNKAQEFANLNSDDGVSDLQNLCGFTPMSPCTNQSEVTCKPVPSNLQRYGRVVVTTKNQNGSTKINSPFLSLILNESNTSTTSKSCSQTAWGKANSASVQLPLAISICDYQADGFKILRDYSSQLTNCPTVIKDSQGINISPQPRNVVNGWAIVSPSGEDLLCLRTRNLTVGMGLDTLPPGMERCNDSSISGSDSKRVLAGFISANLGKKVFVPVIASTSGTGSGSAQRVTSPVVGFFTFIFYGYDLGSNIRDGCGARNCPEFSGVSAAQCGSRDACIWGQFSRGIVPGALVSRDTSFPPVGAQAVELLP